MAGVEYYLNTIDKSVSMLPIVASLAIIVVILFIVFAMKKKSQRNDLGDRNKGWSENQAFWKPNKPYRRIINKILVNYWIEICIFDS